MPHPSGIVPCYLGEISGARHGTMFLFTQVVDVGIVIAVIETDRVSEMEGMDIACHSCPHLSAQVINVALSPSSSSSMFSYAYVSVGIGKRIVTHLLMKRSSLSLSPMTFY